MQSLLHFFGVAFVVQLEEAGEDFSAGGFADRVADALLRWVEAVAEVEETTQVLPPHQMRVTE